MVYSPYTRYQISFIYLTLFLHFVAAEDFEDPIGKGGKVYKGKYPNTKTLPLNSQNSPIAYRHLNLFMNHWSDALSHFHNSLWFLIHDQYRNNSGGEQLVPLSLYWLDEGATTGTALTVFSLANWLGFHRSSQCLALCVSLRSCSFLGLWSKRFSWVLHKTVSGTLKKL